MLSVFHFKTCILVAIFLQSSGQKFATPPYCRLNGSPHHFNVKNDSLPVESSRQVSSEQLLLCEDWTQSSSPRLRVLDQKIFTYAAQHTLTSKDVEVRQRVLDDLARTIGFNVQNITVAGSSCNGFGLRGSSDLDMYLCITKDEIQQLSRVIAKRARESSEFELLRDFVKAKYFAKLHHIDSGMLVDLTVYDDRLPIRSQPGSWAALLRSYAGMDPRFRVLGIFLKVLVDKSRLRVQKSNGLTSLAYLIMLIHYLQQTKPPILPILGTESHYDINGQRNKASLGELWVGFLHYFVHEFHWEEQMVSIRKRRCIRTEERGWRGHGLIAIEHPFSTQDDEGFRLAPQGKVSLFLGFVAQYILSVLNRWLKFYIADSYDGLINHNRVYLEDHPALGWKGNWLLKEDQWNPYNVSNTCRNPKF